MDLLEKYLQIWNNRNLSMDEATPEEALNELVRRELLDENSHPRTRKSKYEKYFLSCQRIVHSELDEKYKLKLIELYTEIMDEI